MKRIISALLALVLVLGMAACGTTPTETSTPHRDQPRGIHPCGVPPRCFDPRAGR